MKKFKKIAAIIVATVTLAATAITAFAADAYFYLGAVKAEYYLANNKIHYSNLKDGYNKNIIYFSDVDKTLMEGNVVLTVDFDNAKNLKKMRADGSAMRFMDSLYLKDANGKFITEGKYPLIVDGNAASRGCLNVMVGHPTIFFNFDLTRSYYYFEKDTDLLQVHYKIPDYQVLPSYNIVLEEISNSPNRVKITGEFGQNSIGYYSINARGDRATLTAGDVNYRIPHQYRGKSFYVYVNSMKVGKVTLPKDYWETASFVNY